MNFSKHITNRPDLSWRIFGFITILLLLPFFFNSSASATNSKFTDSQWTQYSANSIFIYTPCPNGSSNSGNFSSICGNTPKEKYWSLLRQTFDEVHAAAIFGSINHEGSFSPTLWQYTLVPQNSGQFKPDITWDQLYNCSGSSCPGGVGSFQITWSLGPYLQQIAPDLIKYFKDPSYSLKGDQALEKIGATDYDRLVQQEIAFMLKSINQESFKATTTLEEASDWWTTYYENCANCCGEADKDHSCEQIKPRQSIIFFF